MWDLLTNNGYVPDICSSHLADDATTLLMKERYCILSCEIRSMFNRRCLHCRRRGEKVSIIHLRNSHVSIVETCFSNFWEALFDKHFFKLWHSSRVLPDVFWYEIRRWGTILHIRGTYCPLWCSIHSSGFGAVSVVETYSRLRPWWRFHGVWCKRRVNSVWYRSGPWRRICSFHSWSYCFGMIAFGTMVRKVSLIFMVAISGFPAIWW